MSNFITYNCAFSLSSHLQHLLFSHIFSHLVASCSTPLSKIQNLCYICSPPLRHLFLSSHLLTDLTSYLLSLLLSSHFFLDLLHHFYILNHQKLKFMFYIYKLNIYIFSFSRSRATRRLVFYSIFFRQPVFQFPKTDVPWHHRNHYCGRYCLWQERGRSRCQM